LAKVEAFEGFVTLNPLALGLLQVLTGVSLNSS
jgi:hypothetical protein